MNAGIGSHELLSSGVLDRVIRTVAVVVCLGISLQYLLPRLMEWAVLPDFTVFWTAGRFALNDVSKVYDIEAITSAQSWAVDPVHGPRPFPYPPTALLLFVPFALIPFWAAYWAWLGLSVLAFWSAARRVARGWALPFSFAAPHVVLVLILGQTTLVLGSLIIWSVTLLRERPILAGSLLGLAAALKPQAVLLAPLALISGGHWKALVGSALTFSTVAGLSLVFGIDVWEAWLSALRAFPQALEAHRIHIFGATPAMAGRIFHLDLNAILLLQTAGAAIGAGTAWFAFKTDDTLLRLTGLIGGGILASPYAMRYELASLAPVFAACLIHGKIRSWLVALPLFALHSVTIVPAIIVSLSAQFRDKARQGLRVHSSERS